MATITDEYEKIKREAEEYKNLVKEARSNIEEIRNLEKELIDGKAEQLTIDRDINMLIGRRAHLKRIESGLDETQTKLTDKQKQELIDIDRRYAELLKKKKEYNEKQDQLNKSYNYFEDAVKRNIETQKKGLVILEKQREQYSNTINNVKALFNWGKNLYTSWAKYDNSFSKYAKSIGISKIGMDNLRKSTIDFIDSQSISSKYNKSVDELINLQAEYSNQVGRSITMTNKQTESIAAMASVMGDEFTTQFISKLENFGLSADEAGKRFTKMFKDASKRGISLTTYSKNFLDNIKLASSYSFRNGLQGLSRMAEKATQLKLDMSQAVAFAEKTNTVEGAITTAAKLQVLGGPFARYANPMSMLHDSLTNLEGVQERMINMISGFGHFDRNKGEVVVNPYDRPRLKAAVEAMGGNYDNVMEAVNNSAKRRDMQGILDGLKLNENQKSLLTNKAIFQNGKWGVDVGGQFKSINEVGSNSALMKEFERLNASQAQDVKEIAQILRSSIDIEEGLRKQFEAAQANVIEKTGIGENVRNIMTKVSQMANLMKFFIFAQGAYHLANISMSAIGETIFKKNIPFGLSGKSKGSGKIGKIVGNLGKSSLDTSKQIPGVVYNPNIRGGGLRNATTGQFVSKHSADLAQNGGTIMRRGIGRSMTRLGIKTGTNKALGSAAKFLKAGGITAGIGEAIYTSLDEFSGEKNYGVGKKLGRSIGSGVGAGVGTAIGATLGSFLGPVGTFVGGMAGAYLGGVAGKWIGGGFANQNRRERKKDEFGLRELRGDYTVAQLKRIKRAIATGDKTGLKDKDFDALEKNGELDLLNQKINNSNMSIGKASITISSPINGDNYQNHTQFGATGGLITGKSHLEGGVHIKNSNLNVEGGEFLINKKSTKKHFNELMRINNDTTPITPIAPLGKIMKVSPKSNLSYGSGNTTIKIEPININFNGTIRLDTGKQNIDITKEIASNPRFIKELTDMITKQININTYKAYNQNEYYGKYM